MIRNSLLLVSTVVLTLVAGCASSQNDEAASEAAALSNDEPAMGLLLRCDSDDGAKAELSIEKASDGSRITLLVQPLKGFYTIEYRGSDVRAVRQLGAGEATSVPAELLSELGRRDMIHVRPSGTNAKLTIESAQHGDLELSCHFVD